MKLITPDEFAALQKARDAGAVRLYRASGVADLANSSGRIVRYLFSDPSVARDRHTIQGWQTANFERNPVFLWAHQATELPIGRVVEIEDNAGVLRGAVEYAERDVYPFADTIFQMVRGGYLNAVSTSWDPIKWKFSTDRSRPGGIDFELVDLLELSQVPVPALPTALATARANGIDTAPVFEWAGRLLDEGGMALVDRGELQRLRDAARMPAGKRSRPSTLYVSRAVVNHGEIQDWMRGAGFDSSLAGTDMHVTIAYSRAEVDWSQIRPQTEELTVDGGGVRSVTPLGDKGAVVLRFENSALAERWQQLRDAGASWDFPEYHPHVTLTYSGAPDGIEAYDGPIVLGPERFAELNSEWANDIQEVDLKNASHSRSAAPEWKVGASRNLPVSEDDAWDGAEAEASIFDKAGFDGDKPDVSFARKGFLVYDAANPTLKGSYKLPFAKVIDGRLTAMPGGIRNAASRLPQTKELPDEAQTGARDVIDHYEKKMGIEPADAQARATAQIAALKRDFCQVAMLAYILSDLDWLDEIVEWEAAFEQDGSPIPAQLAEAKKMLGDILIAMVGEEVSEMLQEDDGERAAGGVALLRSHAAALASLRAMDQPAAVVVAAQARAGKVLSSENAQALQEAHDMIAGGAEKLRAVMEKSAAAESERARHSNDGEAAMATRSRRARALKLKVGLNAA